MYEGIPKREQKRQNLGRAGLALIASLAGAEASAQTPQSIKGPQHVRSANIEAPKKEDVAWFKSVLEMREVTAEQFSHAEKLVDANRVPLTLQIHFLEATLRAGGHYNASLHREKINDLTFSNILKLVNQVSVRLTGAYAENPHNPDLQRYFNIQNIKDAARIKVDPKTNSFICNEFLTYSMGDVYAVTAEHCLKTPHARAQYSHISVENDQALRRVLPSDYAIHKITVPEKLPRLLQNTQGVTSGRVTVSYSWGSENGGKFKEKVHFSIAVPLPVTLAKKMYGEVDTMSYLKNASIIIKPPAEGRVIGRSEGGDVVLGASGSSGSIVAVETGTDMGYAVSGSLTAVAILEEPCQRICFAISKVSDASSLHQLVMNEQGIRVDNIAHDITKGLNPRSVERFAEPKLKRVN